jgi:RNA polymerase sigma-70 factor (ECF subfamily)
VLPCTLGADPDRLAVIEALRRISADQREVIALHHLIRFERRGISQHTGVRVATVKARLRRGRKALAPYVSESGDDEPATTAARMLTPTTTGPEGIDRV